MVRLRRLAAIRWKAGYTLEASILVPVMLWVLALVMQMGISMYEEVQEQQETEVSLWEVKEFYVYQSVGEIIND